MNSMNCTVKLIGYRKSRSDGMVVSFSIHPNEVPDKLQIDPIGTSYMMALVEVDDATGQPKEVMPTANNRPKQSDTAPCSLTDKPAGGAHKSWDELSPAQQSGILRNDVAFHSFLRNAVNISGAASDTFDQIENAPTFADASAIIIRTYCHVRSCADLCDADGSADRWRILVASYRAWQREPEVVG